MSFGCRTLLEAYYEDIMKTLAYSDGDHVTIHSLDDTSKEYRGRIRGISINDLVQIWIVELIDHIEGHKFSCCTIPSACLRNGWEDYI